MEIICYNKDNLLDNEINEVVTRVKAFLINNNKILIATSDGGCQLPGGHIKANETFKKCLIREIKEEIGILLNYDEIGDPFFEIKYYKKNYKNMGKNRISNVVYFLIKTDKNPNSKKQSLTANERKNNFKSEYVDINDFENFIINFINKNQKIINKIIAEEILVAFNILKGVL